MSDSGNSLKSLAVLYHASGYETSISQDNPIGMLELFDENELVMDRLYTLWQVSGNVQSLSNSRDVYAWVIARASEFSAPVSFKVTLPAIDVIVAAPEGEVVNLFAFEFANGLPLASASREFVASSDSLLEDKPSRNRKRIAHDFLRRW